MQLQAHCLTQHAPSSACRQIGPETWELSANNVWVRAIVAKEHNELSFCCHAHSARPNNVKSKCNMAFCWVVEKYSGTHYKLYWTDRAQNKARVSIALDGTCCSRLYSTRLQILVGHLQGTLTYFLNITSGILSLNPGRPQRICSTALHRKLQEW